MLHLLAYSLISIRGLAWILLLLLFVTIYRIATLPTLDNQDIPNILIILLILARLSTHATPDNILVLAAHSILDSINTIIFFATLITFASFSNLNIPGTPPTQTLLANPLISLLRLAGKLLLLFFVTIYTLATLPTLVDIDIANILLNLLFFIDFLLVPHLIILRFLLLTLAWIPNNTSIFFATLATFSSFSNL